jgi:putative MFS transporter
MGLGLLFTRFQVSESNMFKKSSENKKRGSLILIFQKGRFQRYLKCILLGTPLYFMTGILITFSPEITASLNISGEKVVAGQALLYGTIGLTIGDLLSGVISQILKSRKKAILISLIVALLGILLYLVAPIDRTAQFIYNLCFVLGLAGGYWAVLVTVAAEQFGTNIRGTVATTIPNFVRGSAVLLTLSFKFLKGHMEVGHAALIVGLVAISAALFSLITMKETFHADLDYYEE